MSVLAERAFGNFSKLSLSADPEIPRAIKEASASRAIHLATKLLSAQSAQQFEYLVEENI